MRPPPHILNAATNLLALCVVVIGGLKLTHVNDLSYSDEMAWLALALFFTSTISSYLAIRRKKTSWLSSLADWTFLGGICGLMLSAILGALFL